jgi:hypothetical protein
VIEQERIGRHGVRFVSSDAVELELRGDLALDEAACILRELDARLVAQGRLFILCEVSQLGNLTVGARGHLRHRPKRRAPYVIAYVGAGFKMRVVVDLLDRAAKLLGQDRIYYCFFDRKEEARTWLAGIRDAPGLATAAV